MYEPEKSSKDPPTEDKNIFNNNEDLFRDPVEELNALNRAKNIQKIRNRKLRLMDHIADTMEREANKEEERYENFLNEIKQKEIKED
jgi:hypothetical protein